MDAYFMFIFVYICVYFNYIPACQCWWQINILSMAHGITFHSHYLLSMDILISSIWTRERNMSETPPMVVLVRKVRASDAQHY